MMRRSRALVTIAAILAATAACNNDGGVGPDPIAPQFYDLEMIDNGSLPYLMFTDAFGGKVFVESATLVPYAVGRTVDSRLLNDRTGRGGSGGNTRDTTVARGQMMDIRIIRQTTAAGGVTYTKDSTLVDVQVQDTSFIISRPHPDPARVRVDTGYYVGSQLIVPTLLDYRPAFNMTPRMVFLNYTVTR
jgi:predicted small secreted protein